MSNEFKRRIIPESYHFRKDEIWVLTDFAWYILGLPSQSYTIFFQDMLSTCVRKRKKPGSVPISDTELLPVVTPTVSKLAKGLFLRSELIAGHAIDESDEELANICVPDVPFVVHDSNPEDMRWGKGTDGSDCFDKVILDNIEYHASLDHLLLIAIL